MFNYDLPNNVRSYDFLLLWPLVRLAELIITVLKRLIDKSEVVIGV